MSRGYILGSHVIEKFNNLFQEHSFWCGLPGGGKIALIENISLIIIL